MPSWESHHLRLPLQLLSNAVAYDPNSSDSMFARVLSELKNQNDTAAQFRENAKDLAEQTLAAIQAIGSRVTTLENQKWFERGIVAAIGVAGSALWNWFHSK